MRGELSEKARKIAANAKSTLHRDHAERPGRDEGNAGEEKQPGKSAPLGEKLRGWKDKVTLGAKDLAAKAKSRFDALRVPEEETPEDPPAPQIPAVPPQPRQPVSPADDVNDYTAEETIAPDMFRQKDDEKQN
ncbi:hypothetical protein RAH42_05020 [Pyramidobacter sp. YE332]|nr:hypothetical protein [Pyramidobacter sp. YE332]WOL41003.1 hypothetical protein RAH42_05020 [Pyramidobacter sp. YE332]